MKQLPPSPTLPPPSLTPSMAALSGEGALAALAPSPDKGNQH